VSISRDDKRILLHYNKFVEHVESKGGKCIKKLSDYKNEHYWNYMVLMKKKK
jgi:hypothetical protein